MAPWAPQMEPRPRSPGVAATAARAVLAEIGTALRHVGSAGVQGMTRVPASGARAAVIQRSVQACPHGASPRGSDARPPAGVLPRGADVLVAVPAIMVMAAGCLAPRPCVDDRCAEETSAHPGEKWHTRKGKRNGGAPLHRRAIGDLEQSANGLSWGRRESHAQFCGVGDTRAHEALLDMMDQ